jgi:hypothetical protein
MPWFKVERRMGDHPAAWRVGNAAFGAWVRMGCWLATWPEEGEALSRHIVKRYATKREVDKLVAAGLLIPSGEDYRLGKSMAICSSGLAEPAWDIDTSESRRTIPPRVRAFVYDRDGRACVECGATTDLTLDHIWPFSLGGDDSPENLRTLCRPCNSRKGARV